MARDFIGFGALGEAFLALEAERFSRIFVVASKSGWERLNSPQKRSFFADREMELFSAFSVNPDFREILAGVTRYKAFKPDLVVALGGGSPIDVAKVIKAEAHSHEPYDPRRPETIKPSGEGPPLAAIATTAGSGSEATQYAVFYLGDTKQSIAHPSIRPEYAIVDPELTYSLSPHQTAATGFDALSQAIEAYWSALTNPEAREYASAAIRYALPNIHQAVTAPNPASRYNMAQAAYLSGKAINTTRTTMPHALGYYLTKHYGLPHGHAVALTLPYFFILNLDPNCPVTTPLGEKGNREAMLALFTLLGQDSQENAFTAWRSLMRSCGLAAAPAEIGMTTPKQVHALVASINPTRLRNHPVAIDPAYLEKALLSR